MNAGSFTDAAGNLGRSGTDSVAINTVNPNVAITFGDTSLNNKVAHTYVTFKFSDNVKDFSAADITVEGGTLSGFETRWPHTYRAIFTADANSNSPGRVSVKNDSYEDHDGNPGSGGTATIPVDTVAPRVAVHIENEKLTIGRTGSPVKFVFSEPVTGFSAADLEVQGGTISGIQQINVHTYEAIFEADSEQPHSPTQTTSTTIKLGELAAEMSIGNFTIGTTATAAVKSDVTKTVTQDDFRIGSVRVRDNSYMDRMGNPGAGSQDQIEIDVERPQVKVNFESNHLSSDQQSSLIKFEFTEPIAGFDASDLQVTGGVVSNFKMIGSDSYEATFSANSNSIQAGTVVVNGVYRDLRGNLGTAGGDTVTIDTTASRATESFTTRPQVVVIDANSDPELLKSDFQPDFVSPFAQPCYFPRYRYDICDDGIPRESLVIYEGMTLALKDSGEYEVSWNMEVPRTTVVMRLQLTVWNTSIGETGVISLPPVVVTPDLDADRQNPTRSVLVRVRGFSNYIAQHISKSTTGVQVSRRGRVRFGSIPEKAEYNTVLLPSEQMR